MRARTGLASAAVLLAMTPLLAHRPLPVVRSGVRETRPHRVRGAVHVHTEASGDARGSVDDVAQAAREAGLDFIVLADHNTDASLGAGAYRHGVLVIGGFEKSTDGGHAVVLGITELPFRLDGDPATVVRDVTDRGGFVIAAHPFSSNAESRWTGGLEGITAVEALNLAEPDAWPRGVARLLPLARYPLDPQGALLAGLRAPAPPFALWDRVTRSRPLAGVFGSDAHGTFVSHREIFRLASQHLLLEAPLTGEAIYDGGLVLEALRRGRGYGALDSQADASGFLLEARSGDHSGTMGEDVPLEGDAQIRAEADAPPGTTLALLRNGVEVARGPRVLYRTREAGAYRVQAFLDPAAAPGAPEVPWVVSNPVYVYPAAELAARKERARALPPEEPAAAEMTEPIDAFDTDRLATEWIPERSDDAVARLAVEGGALRLDYALGPGTRTHAAACSWKRRDLSSCRNLVFRVRADRPTRFDVQVRVADSASPGGVRIWRRSVRAALDWRRAVVSLPDLKTYDKRGGLPDLRNVESLHFHVDEATMAPGSRGVLFIDDVGLAPGP